MNGPCCGKEISLPSLGKVRENPSYFGKGKFSCPIPKGKEGCVYCTLERIIPFSTVAKIIVPLPLVLELILSYTFSVDGGFFVSLSERLASFLTFLCNGSSLLPSVRGGFISCWEGNFSIWPSYSGGMVVSFSLSWRRNISTPFPMKVTLSFLGKRGMFLPFF